MVKTAVVLSQDITKSMIIISIPHLVSFPSPLTSPSFRAPFRTMFLENHHNVFTTITPIILYQLWNFRFKFSPIIFIISPLHFLANDASRSATRTESISSRSI